MPFDGNAKALLGVDANREGALFVHGIGGEHMQKLVSIYLDNTAYGAPKVTGCYADKHAFVEEHLQEYLTKEWRVSSLFGLGGSSGLCCQGWVAVVLEKEKEG